MEQKKLLKYLVVLMFAIFLADKIGDSLNWYHEPTFWWFDIVMHFLGGFWISLFFIYFFHYVLPVKNWLVLGLLGLLAWAIGWEVFEFFVFNNIGGEPFSWGDTIADIFWDLVGGGVAIYYTRKKIMPTLKIPV